MTKDQLQKELEEKVKPGIKPSDLRKLKRSKSADDIPTSPPQEKQITQLQAQIQFHSQTAQNYLKSLQISQAKVSELEEKLKNNPPSQLLTDQLQAKQKEIESLRQQLEVKNTPTELDQSLISRHQSLKDWFTQYKKNQSLEQELAENIDEASNELINQDNQISSLRKENQQLKLTNQSLTKDLNLATKLAELRKSPLPNSATGKNLPQNLFYCLFIALLIYSLIGSNPKPNEN